MPLLEGRDGAKSPHEAFFYRTEAVRSGKWKLKGKELYDLEADISETKNVADAHPEVVTRLKDRLAAYKADLAKNSRPAGGPKKPPRKKRNRSAAAKK